MVTRNRVGRVLLLLVLVICGCQEKSESAGAAKSSTTPELRELDIRYEIADPEERGAATKAFEVLNKTCRLLTLSDDLAEIRVSIEDLDRSHYLTERYGWRRVVRVEPRFREIGDLKTARWDHRRIGGHRFDFRLGGGTAPGITADKWIGQELCGMQAKPGETGYLTVDGLRVMDAIDIPDAKRATRPTPKRIDFVALFQREPAGVRELLGEPGRDQYGEEQYVFPDLRISVRYRDGKAARAEVSSSTMDMKALRRWVGKPNRKQTKREELDGVIYISSTRMPATDLDVMKVLGAPAAEVGAYLGPMAKLEHTWERDGYGLAIELDDEGIVQYLAITFDSGLHPSEQSARLRRWAGIPPSGSTVTARGQKYTIALDDMSMVFQRR
jgi:hypothetical protein